MGYTTDFSGELKLSKKATKAQVKYINTFSGTRRMKRDPKILNTLYKGEHGYPGLKGHYGTDGEFFAMDDGNAGQMNDKSVIDGNTPPSTQPGLWCQWCLSEDGSTLQWDMGEKFYEYIEWLNYMIDNFFKGWGIVLNGTIHWRGEDMEDNGVIEVTNNEVSIRTLS